MNDGWETVSIRDVCEAIYDGPHATPKKTADGPIFLGISNLQDGQINLSDAEHLSEEDFIRWTRRVTPQEDDIVFSYETRLGEAALVPNGLRFCLGRRMALMRPNTDKVVPRFLLYAYLGPEFQQTLRARTVRGSTVDRIPLLEFPSFPISLPTLPEQHTIAGILGALDDKIELNRRMNRTLKSLARAVFYQWFVESGEASSWDVKRIGEFASVVDHVANGSFALLREKVRLYDEPEYAIFVRTTDSRSNFSGSLRYVDKPTYDFLKKTQLNGREFIISNVGDTGSVFRAPNWIGQPMVLGNNAILVRANEYTDFLYHLFTSELGQAMIDSIVTGSVQMKFNKTDFRSLKISLPPQHVLDKFNAFIVPVQEKIAQNIKETRTLVSLRDTLLPKLMRGEVRVSAL